MSSFVFYIFDYEHSSPLAVPMYSFGFRLSILHLNILGHNDHFLNVVLFFKEDSTHRSDV